MSVSPAGRALLSRHLGNQTRLSAHGSGTATPEGSATQTITSGIPAPDGLVLRLRGADETTTTTETEDAQPSTRRRIQWAEDVIDNEGLGRKRSKVCCIYHKTRDVGESSSEDDSSSSSDSDGGSSPSDDDGSARPIGGRRRKGRGRRRERRHRHDHEHKDGDECGNPHEAKRKPSPNAYERMPKYDVKPLERQPGS